MPPKNPWYLITSDEIDTIKRYMQSTAGGIPDPRENRVVEVLQLIDRIRDRQP
jgi:hypothetical protein